MNETPRIHGTEPLASFFATNTKDSPKLFQKTPSSNKVCQDNESFAMSPIQMDFDTPKPTDDDHEPLSTSNDYNRETNTNREDLDTSFPQHDEVEISPPEESEEQRLQREIEESEALARQLMAEEALASYNMSSAFLRENAHQFSADDLAALQSAMAEEDPEAEEYDDGEDGVNGEMSYDAMIRLGERIGNVKEERWAFIAQEKIQSIPILVWDPSMAAGKDENHTEVKCQVCQFGYEEGEELRRLGCGHCFHKECIDEWLGTKDTCAFRRKSIVI
jgi:hypothetical protein